MGAAAKVAPIVIVAVTCGKCRELKLPCEFPRNRRNLHGLASYCTPCNTKWQRENPERRRITSKESAYRRRLRLKFKISPQDYVQMWVDQQGRCAICNLAMTEGRNGDSAALDHCHETDKVRGLLCNNCNNGLGRFKDNPEWLERAANYLRLHSPGRYPDPSYDRL